jgi:hypothetical protein
VRDEGEALRQAHGGGLLPARQREPHRHARAGQGFHGEAGAGEQVQPAAPGVEAQVGAVEEAAVVLGKAAQQHVQAEPGVAAVGERGHQAAAGGEQAAQLDEPGQGVAQVFQDVGADDVVKGAVERGDAGVEVRLHQPHGGREAGPAGPGHVDAGDAVAAARQDFPQVPLGAAHVEQQAPVPVGRQGGQEQAMTGVGTGIEPVRGRRLEHDSIS